MHRFCSTLMITLCLLLVMAAPALADWTSRSGETVIVKASEEIPGDLWCNGNTVIIDGTVDGDLLVAAANVTINGEVKGSIIGLAYNYLQRGKLDGNLRFISLNEMKVAGPVSKNISVWYLKKFHMTSKSSAQSLRAFGIYGSGIETVLDGDIHGKVFTKAMMTSINGRIGGDCVVIANSDQNAIHIKSSAKLHSLKYTAPKAPTIEKGAIVGSVKEIPPQRPSPEERQEAMLLAWMWFTGTLIIGFLLIRILPFRAVEWASGSIRWFAAMAAGMAVLFGGAVLFLLLFFTGIGTPLALLIGTLYISLLLIGPLPAYIYIGGALVRLFRVEKRFPVVFLLLVGGVVVFLISTTLPMGLFFTALATALGIGLLVLRTQKIIIAKTQNSPDN
ncbi:MAG TPA: hypothetical protein VHR47_09175 [Bacillota bacterium]|nr:hypothetical protein [Bacillota bacterium]